MYMNIHAATFCFSDTVEMMGDTYESIVWKNITEDEYANLSSENKANYVLNESSYSGSGPMYTLKQVLHTDGTIGYNKLISLEEYTHLEDDLKLNYKLAHKMYSHVPITLEEMKAAYDVYVNETKPLSDLRRKCDMLLKETDKYTISDWPHPTEEVKQAWLDYRQALRDLPANTTDPKNPVWPNQPSP